MGQQRRQAVDLRLCHQQQRYLYNHYGQAWSPSSSSRYSKPFVQLGRMKLKHPTTSPSSNLRSINFRYYFNTRRVIPKEGSETIAAKTVPLVSESRSNWTRFAWYVKIARLPFLISAIYALGYQQGVMQTASNPLKLQQGFFETICIDLGVTSGEDIDIISERRPASVKKGWLNFTSSGFMATTIAETHDPRTERVATIGRNIIRAARYYVREELHKAIQEATERLDKQEAEELESSSSKNNGNGNNESSSKKSLTPAERKQYIHDDENVAKWLEAQLRVEGETLNGIENWQYILVGTPTPNAFVSQLLPQRFFVTTGLFEQFVSNDDELAMILGHEISHLILGHLSQSNNVEFMFRGAELFILAIDPVS